MNIKKHMNYGRAALIASALAVGVSSSAFAGSNDSANTYPADAHSMLPTGTLIVQQYAAVTTSDTNVGYDGKKTPGKNNLDVYQSITRINYFTELFGNRLVLSAAAGYADVDEVRTAGVDRSVKDGFADPAVFFSYFFIRDVTAERWLVTSQYFYLPVGRRYDEFTDVNVSTANQFTWVPQIVYAEGLSKYGLKNLYIDLIANASIHDDGDSPVARNVGLPSPPFPAGSTTVARYGKVTQENTYNVQAYLTYKWNPITWVSVGVEKSWGGEQFAVNPNAVVLAGGGARKLQIGEVDYFRGHLAAAIPLAPDLQLAGRLSHDFDREGGFQQDLIAELRLTKFLVPTPTEAPLK